MHPQEEIKFLHAMCEQLRIENIQMQAALGYGILAEDERHIIPSNPFKCGTCGPKADTITRLTAENERLQAALWDIHAICNNGPFVWAKRIRAIARVTLRGRQPND